LLGNICGVLAIALPFYGRAVPRRECGTLEIDRKIPTTKTLPAPIQIPLVLTLSAGVASAQSETAPSTLKTYSTVHSIGIEWFIVGAKSPSRSATTSKGRLSF
jgi:hypothetical protein